MKLNLLSCDAQRPDRRATAQFNLSFNIKTTNADSV